MDSNYFNELNVLKESYIGFLQNTKDAGSAQRLLAEKFHLPYPEAGKKIAEALSTQYVSRSHDGQHAHEMYATHVGHARIKRLIEGEAAEIEAM